MKRKKIDIENQNEQQKGEYVVHRSRLSDVIAIVVCLALALVIWVAVMNAPDTDYIATEVLDTSGEYTYTLSEAHLEVEGTVADLRRAKSIGICVPQDIVPGVPYTLTEEDLVIPEGVRLVGTLELTLTVRQK